MKKHGLTGKKNAFKGKLAKSKKMTLNLTVAEKKYIYAYCKRKDIKPALFLRSSVFYAMGHDLD